LALATSIVLTWAAIHVYGVFLYRMSLSNIWIGGSIIIIETWLSAGMFIVAHDAMHGSLSPGMPSINRWVGRLCLGFYAFFPYDAVAAKHYAHHRFSGRGGDPDFYGPNPHAFWPWYWRFFREYFGFGQFAAIFGVVMLYALVLHAQIFNILLFWALPAIASSLQLFTFGTWLPHRHASDGFIDGHNARTLEFNGLASLVACFHFGYHVEHHRSPQSPWWALPKVRAARTVSERQS
jgi:beta-carotene ketolase (CrtW type)